MASIEIYTPTRIVFGAGCLDELAEAQLPGSRALVCTTRSSRPAKHALIERVQGLLRQAGADSVVFDGLSANPTKDEVHAARDLAADEGCDFVVGLGGGSSIDAAKAIAALMRMPGDLWDYAYTGSGLKREITDAAPVVTITTTAGTGSETDPYSVITKTETQEKLDFAAEALFPVLSVIDPELMVSVPRNLTLYQGIDALFHAAECAITNRAESRMVDLLARESIESVVRWLPVVLDEPGNIEGRTALAFAANICSGYTQALINTTSHHIIAQTIGGMFPRAEHGATLIMIALAYYRSIARFVPQELDHVAAYFGEQPDGTGAAFVTALEKLFTATGADAVRMSDYGIARDDLPAIADAAVNRTGIADVDLYTLTERDVLDILERSYR